MPGDVTAARDPAARPPLQPEWLLFGSRELPAQADQVGEARRFIAWIAANDACAETAQLLTSEIVTNAILHSRSRLPGGRVVLAAVRNAGGLMVTVTDDGSDAGVPVVAHSEDDEHGNGLLLVDSLADAWGYRNDDRRTTVWFRLGAEGHGPCGASAAGSRLLSQLRAKPAAAPPFLSGRRTPLTPAPSRWSPPTIAPAT